MELFIHKFHPFQRKEVTVLVSNTQGIVLIIHWK